MNKGAQHSNYPDLATTRPRKGNWNGNVLYWSLSKTFKGIYERNDETHIPIVCTQRRTNSCLISFIFNVSNWLQTEYENWRKESLVSISRREKSDRINRVASMTDRGEVDREGVRELQQRQQLWILWGKRKKKQTMAVREKIWWTNSK